MTGSETRTLHTTMNEYDKRYEGLGTLIDAVVDDGADWALGGGWYVEETEAGGIVISKYTELEDENTPADPRVVADISPDDIDTREWVRSADRD